MIKKILQWSVFFGTIVLVIFVFASKDKLTQHMSNTMKQNATSETIDNSKAYINAEFNYLKNGKEYEMTFLEFGSKGCIACMKMERVMEEVKQNYPNKVNVVFINILKPENQKLMEYYGVAVIPTQVLLNKEGEEFYRHSGYISEGDLSLKFRLNQ